MKLWIEEFEGLVRAEHMLLYAEHIRSHPYRTLVSSLPRCNPPSGKASFPTLCGTSYLLRPISLLARCSPLSLFMPFSYSLHALCDPSVSAKVAVQRCVERVQGFIKGILRELEEAVKRHGKKELKIELLISSLAYILCCLTFSSSPATK